MSEIKTNSEDRQEEKRSRKAFAWLIKMARRKNALVSVSIAGNKKLFDIEASVKSKNFFEQMIK